MANEKVFADKQTDQQTGKKLFAPNLLMRGCKKLQLSQIKSVCRHQLKVP